MRWGSTWSWPWLMSIKAFSKWCFSTDRTKEDTLYGVEGYNAKEDPRHDRRTIALDELILLIGTAERGPVVMGMSGPARSLCYQLAATTGLRYSEIASIVPASFNCETPSVSACYTKNGDPAYPEGPGRRPGCLRGPVESADACLPPATRQGSQDASRRPEGRRNRVLR
jgi:hypothetical protein